MFTEDISAFFAVAEFAQAVTLNGVACNAIFDNGFSLGDVGSVGMASAQPNLTLASTSVPADPVGMPVVVGGVTYEVAAHEPDGAGVSVLLLELA